MYLYKHAIVKSPDDWQGMTQAEKDAHNANKSDFETNYKSQAVQIDEFIIAQNTFVIWLSYANFKAKVSGGILWSDVKYMSHEKYVLHLTSSNPLP